MSQHLTNNRLLNSPAAFIHDSWFNSPRSPPSLSPPPPQKPTPSTVGRFAVLPPPWSLPPADSLQGGALLRAPSRLSFGAIGRHFSPDSYGNREFIEHLRNRGKLFDHEEKRERDLILIDDGDPARNVYEATKEWAFHNGHYGTRENVVFGASRRSHPRPPLRLVPGECNRPSQTRRGPHHRLLPEAPGVSDIQLLVAAASRGRPFRRRPADARFPVNAPFQTLEGRAH